MFEYHLHLFLQPIYKQDIVNGEMCQINTYPDSKVPGANMGPIRGWQDPGGPHVGLTNFAIWVYSHSQTNHIVNALDIMPSLSSCGLS